MGFPRQRDAMFLEVSLKTGCLCLWPLFGFLKFGLAFCCCGIGRDRRQHLLAAKRLRLCETNRTFCLGMHFLLFSLFYWRERERIVCEQMDVTPLCSFGGSELAPSRGSCLFTGFFRGAEQQVVDNERADGEHCQG